MEQLRKNIVWKFRVFSSTTQQYKTIYKFFATTPFPMPIARSMIQSQLEPI